MKVLIINNKIKECGVYQYGRRVGKILEKSENHSVVYLEIDSVNEFFYHIDKEQPSVIVYNYLGCILPWCSQEVISNIRQRGIKQGTIIHNSPQNFFDFNLQQDPNYQENQNNYRLLRPLIDYNKVHPLSDDVVRIGSFGFGLNCKNYPLLCQIIKDHCSNIDKNIELRFHLTVGAFANNNLNFIENISNECRSILSDSKIKLILSTDFIPDEDLLDFLNQNHINVFFYEKYDFYNGISSSVDYALSSARPIAICKSNMFSHIWSAVPSICLEDTNINDIIHNGIEPILPFLKAWSHENFIANFERIVELVK